MENNYQVCSELLERGSLFALYIFVSDKKKSEAKFIALGRCSVFNNTEEILAN